MTTPLEEARDRRPDEPVLVRIEPGSVQTIERTGKRWKAIIAISSLLLVLGLGACSWAIARDPRALTHPPLLSWIGGLTGLAGLLGVLIGRIGAWWYHG